MSRRSPPPFVSKLPCLARPASFLLPASRSRKLLHSSAILSLLAGLSVPTSGVEASVGVELNTLLRLIDAFMDVFDETRRKKGDIGPLRELFGFIG